MRYVSFYHRHTDQTPIHHHSTLLGRSDYYTPRPFVVHRLMVGIRFARNVVSAVMWFGYAHNTPNDRLCTWFTIHKVVFQGAIDRTKATALTA